VAGVGDGLTAGLVRHSQRKRGATDRPGLRGTAPALDPTDVAGAGDVARGAGLRPTAKAVELPPDPTVRAPALDPTDEREVETGHGGASEAPANERAGPIGYT
jgi:hypothetical protein